MIQEKLGLRIKELRAKNKISQLNFALKVELDPTYIASIEKGRRNVSIKNLEKIAKGFDITLSELLKDL